MRRQLAALLATLVAGAGLYACAGNGAKNHTATSTSSSSSTMQGTSTNANAASSEESPLAQITPDKDRDNDPEAPYDDHTNREVTSFGHAVDQTERRTIVALIRHYYAAALADDGATACALLYTPLAEAVPEDYSGKSGVPYMRGAKTCAAALTMAFKHLHPLLALETPKLRVTSIHAEGHRGLAQLKFGNLPERQTSFSLERHTWKMTALIDRELQ